MWIWWIIQKVLPELLPQVKPGFWDEDMKGVMYNDLHVFELQEPTRVIEWIQDRSICVAGCNVGKKNEILELSLPQKLCAKGNQGLCPERDFTVEHGGFSQRPIYELKHVAGTSILVSSGPPDTSLQVWRLATEESDAIMLASMVQHQTAGGQWSKISVICSPTPQVLHGSKVNNLAIQEIASQKVLFTTGFNGTVHIYNTSLWSAELTGVEPTFVHRGHSVAVEPEREIPLVTRHVWHPWKRQTLLSAADDGSFHVWDWAGHNSGR
ncbi:WD repeat-containing protein 73 isoform X4 [Heterodontus francisci]|uniref:WD repeat-containing protein 73 isoform X4 n=1 Tax=Heterodontus francisci TaxID=7792 RepID=UPI00355BECFD